MAGASFDPKKMFVQRILDKISETCKRNPVKLDRTKNFEKFSCVLFDCYCQGLISGWETDYLAMFSPKYENFLIFVMRCAISFLLFVQFKKREKHPWKSVIFSKVAGFSFFKLYKLYQIVQRTTFKY